MDNIFIAESAEKFTQGELHAARKYLVDSLRRFTAIHLESCGDAETIHRTDVCTLTGTENGFDLSWHGFIGSSDYRNDGILVYGAHLFPFIGGKRACVVRIQNSKGYFDLVYRYLMLTPETGWEDRGWQVDEYGEYEHWYLDTDC